jgi:hypothetical protein
MSRVRIKPSTSVNAIFIEPCQRRPTIPHSKNRFRWSSASQHPKFGISIVVLFYLMGVACSFGLLFIGLNGYVIISGDSSRFMELPGCQIHIPRVTISYKLTACNSLQNRAGGLAKLVRGTKNAKNPANFSLPAFSNSNRFSLHICWKCRSLIVNNTSDKPSSHLRRWTPKSIPLLVPSFPSRSRSKLAPDWLLSVVDFRPKVLRQSSGAWRAPDCTKWPKQSTFD